MAEQTQDQGENKYAKYFKDVQKYAQHYDEAVIEVVAKHCGIALIRRDSALVSCSDPKELSRVRDGFMRKKLARTETDDELDEVLKTVCKTMQDSRQKSRVTFYYLVAEHFGQLGLFVKAKAKKKS